MYIVLSVAVAVLLFNIVFVLVVAVRSRGWDEEQT